MGETQLEGNRKNQVLKKKLWKGNEQNYTGNQGPFRLSILLYLDCDHHPNFSDISHSSCHSILILEIQRKIKWQNSV